MKKLIIDFDSTIVKIETLDALAQKSLENEIDKDAIISEIKKITEMGMNGEISFPESLKRRIALIKTNKKTVEDLAQSIREQLSNSILRNLDFFKINARNTIIISGGFKDLILPTTDYLKIPRENVLANEFVFDESDNLAGVNQDNLMAKDNGKVNQIKALNLEGELVMVGDGWTDYQTKEFNVVDKFIAYTENVTRQKVVDKADLVADDFKKVIEYFI